MDKIILDTNALIYAIQNKIDLENGIMSLFPRMEPLVPACVSAELRGLATTKWYAKAALKYSERFKHVESSGEGDFCIMVVARKLNAAVLTNDKNFRRILKSEGISCVTIGSQNNLQFY
jgi:rRNA-processing protein FCF1